jgi:hypothetical protein
MLELNYNYDNSDNLIENLENEDEDSDRPILENNEEENYDIYNFNSNLLGNFYNNNSPDFQVQIIDISNLTSNFLINFIENNINTILQNSIHGTNDTPFIQNFIDSTFELDNKKKFKRVTHNDEIIKLKIQKFDSSNIYANNECPINLTKFEEDDEIIILPCNHVYSALPIQKWLNKESNCCPTCRFELQYKEIKCEENNDEENEDLLENNEERNEVENEEREENNPVNDYYNDDEDIILQQILLNSCASNNST